MKRVLAMLLVALLLLSGCGTDTAKPQKENKTTEKTRWGVDIQGGADLRFGPADGTVIPTDEQLDAVKGIIEQRLVERDITSYEAYVDKTTGEVAVRFPWTEDQASAEELAEDLIRSGMLQFYEGEGSQDSDGYDIPPAADHLILDGRDVQSAYPGLMEVAAAPTYVVTLQFNDAGAAKFAAATKKLAGHGKISIWLDVGAVWAMVNSTARYFLLQVADVNEAITGGEAIITGFADYEEAKEVADRISFGALPFALTVKSVSVISPTMGQH